MKISDLIRELEGFKEDFGDIAIRRTDYDLDDGAYYLCNPTLYVTDINELLSDDFLIVLPDELGEYVLEIG